MADKDKREKITSALVGKGFDALPIASVEDRRHLAPIGENEGLLPGDDPRGWREKYRGTMGGAAWTLPSSPSTPLGRTIGVDADLNALKRPPSYEVLVPAGAAVDVSMKQLEELWGPGATVRGRAMKDD